MSLPGRSGARSGKAATATEKRGLLFNPRDKNRSEGECRAAGAVEGAPSKPPASSPVSERDVLLWKGSWITCGTHFPQAPRHPEPSQLHWGGSSDSRARAGQIPGWPGTIPERHK